MQLHFRQPTPEAPPRTALFAPESAPADDCLSFSPSDDNYLSPEWGGDDWGDAIGDDYDGYDRCDDAYAAQLRAHHLALYAQALCIRPVAPRHQRPRRRSYCRRARLDVGAGGNGDPAGPARRLEHSCAVGVRR